ncbi:poly(R)-hydroxyalkanoic acid synthase [Paraburkholderia monticola]|uniref:Poly(R)-hydroxyalkanoic acid synthase n=1 Tax=Paraburkholderia monticola TaxID=1399968 RepID=A0A149PD58_9BURK|nr:class I poly(R)-hydroxyalkanoic acid synthase [Paraburkholderia monticola]KXU82953.1 poly(R)-hydroxyalkanoic acid synthase [Paraburkholderia monticola]
MNRNAPDNALSAAGNDGPAAPDPLAALARQYWDQQWRVWQTLAGASPGAENSSKHIEPAAADRRFDAPEWRSHPWYAALMQSYLANADLLAGMVGSVEADAKTRQRLRFMTRQLIDAASPANFALTNPEAARLALESAGATLCTGLANWLTDTQRGQMHITDEDAFEVGRNVATSVGTVVFENELMQLIQYAPLTAKVARRPLLIVPPCVNKFYILDLQPRNSFVRFALEEGYSVFLISWRNPRDESRHTTWDDYLEQGVMQAIRVTLAITGADQVNTLGWCVGGTMLASALAVLAARDQRPAASMTLLTTLLDFAEPGDLGTFVDERVVAQVEQIHGGGGLLDGRALAFVFQSLRANELIWPYVAGNYLQGQTPPAFDLLYWNSDATNLPGPMYTWLLRHGYLQNELCMPGKLSVCGAPFDLGKTNTPAYVLATERDHLVPWRPAWRTTQLLGGETQFVLAASGHIAGVINAPSANKRNYWTGGEHEASDADDWFAHATPHDGSWWPHWSNWLRQYAGKNIAAPKRAGNDAHCAIEPAPGRYVKERLT